MQLRKIIGVHRHDQAGHRFPEGRQERAEMTAEENPSLKSAMFSSAVSEYSWKTTK